MTSISIHYGQGRQSLTLAGGRRVNILEAPEPRRGNASPQFSGGLNSSAGNGLDSPLTEEEIISRALAAPIGSPPLAELAAGARRVVIVTSDHTRPVPSRLTLPPMLAEIRRGAPEALITILIAVGSHRATTYDEMVEKFGRELVENERIINHDPIDEKNLVSLGLLPSGGEMWLNRLAAEADLLVADGFIEPHQFAGFSGGRKSILPGISGLKSVLASHNAEFTVHPQARPGRLEGNPFQADMLYAARAAGLRFILNVTLNAAKKVSAAFAGDMEAAHLAGCRFVSERCAVKAVPAPIVITANGGYPLDQNIYQATKSVMAADLTCAESGVIIAVNECSDGHGGEGFYQAFKAAASPAALLAEIRARGRDETRPDQWVIQLLADILQRRRVIWVSRAPAEMVRTFGFQPAPGLAEALALAESMVGDAMAPITVLPDAVSLIVEGADG